MVDVLYNYDELPEKDKRLFNGHMTTCPACAKEYQEMAAVLRMMDLRQRPEMGEEYWDSYYRRLMEKNAVEVVKTSLIRQTFDFLANSLDLLLKRILPAQGIIRRWVLYPVAALLLVVVGIAIGRHIYLPPVPERGGELFSSSYSSGPKFNPVVAEHFETVRPLLIDCVNYTAGEAPNGGDEFVMVDKKTLKKLALQNYLLKRIALRENDVVLTRLLEELELILLEISNAETGDINSDNDGREAVGHVRDILIKNDTLFKMKIYNKSENNRDIQAKI